MKLFTKINHPIMIADVGSRFQHVDISMRYCQNRGKLYRTLFIGLLLLGVMLTYHKKWLLLNWHRDGNSSSLWAETSLEDFSQLRNKSGKIGHRIYHVIVPKLLNPRKPIDRSLQQLINISLKTFEPCPDGRYSRSLRVLIQREWKTDSVIEEPKNASNIPLIVYGSQSALYRKLNSSGCRYLCEFSTNARDIGRATLAVYTRQWGRHFIKSGGTKLWAFETQESPLHIHMPDVSVESEFSIFVTYLTDAIVPWAYGMFMPFERPHCLIPDRMRKAMATEDSRRFLPAHHKQRTKLAAWVVSNLGPSARKDKFAEMSKFMKIDRYGRNHIPCGPIESQACFAKLSTEYKFYLAFENSNCSEYITEKLYENALRNGMVPIVFGAPSDDYYELAPPNSYIDSSSFPSTEELVNYIKWLDSNDTAYASYFAWKKYGYLDNRSSIDCQICGVLHNILNGNLDSQKNDFRRFTDRKTLCQQ